MSVNIAINLDSDIEIKVVANNVKIISCPGIWLCTNGFLEITLKCLGHFFKSTPLEPKFPVFCYQRFNIDGYFESVSCYHEFSKILKEEKFEISLWQSGRRLAFYNGRLFDLLQFNDIEILMKSSNNFPGIIAPKLQMNSKGFVSDETNNPDNTFEANHNRHHTRQLYNVSRCSNSSGTSEISNSSSEGQVMELRIQKPVCHSKKYEWKKNRNSAKNSLPLIDEDANSLKSLSLHSSDDNYSLISKLREKKKVYEVQKCDHNGVDGCEICIVYRRTFRS